MKGTGISVVDRKLLFHNPPVGPLVSKHVSQNGGDLLRSLGEFSGTQMFEQFQVALFLAGHEMVNDHRALGGNGFVNRRATGLADDEMVAVQEGGNTAGPTDQFHPTRELALDFLGSTVKKPLPPSAR